MALYKPQVCKKLEKYELFLSVGGVFGRDQNKIKSRRGQRPLLHLSTQLVYVNRTLGSTKEYEISVIINPTIYNTEPKKTIDLTIAKSCRLMASMV